MAYTCHAFHETEHCRSIARSVSYKDMQGCRAGWIDSVPFCNGSKGTKRASQHTRIPGNTSRFTPAPTLGKLHLPVRRRTGSPFTSVQRYVASITSPYSSFLSFVMSFVFLTPKFSSPWFLSSTRHFASLPTSVERVPPSVLRPWSWPEPEGPSSERPRSARKL